RERAERIGDARASGSAAIRDDGGVAADGGRRAVEGGGGVGGGRKLERAAVQAERGGGEGVEGARGAELERAGGEGRRTRVRNASRGRVERQRARALLGEGERAADRTEREVGVGADIEDRA